MNAAIGVAVYYGFHKVFKVEFQSWALIAFIVAGITPDLAWGVYISDYWGIFPSVPPTIIPIVQFFHGIPMKM